MTYKGYIARELDASETMFYDLKRLVEYPGCPPDVREHVQGVLHEYEMAKRAVHTNAARRAAQAALIEIEKESEGPQSQCM